MDKKVPSMAGLYLNGLRLDSLGMKPSASPSFASDLLLRAKLAWSFIASIFSFVYLLVFYWMYIFMAIALIDFIVVIITGSHMGFITFIAGVFKHGL